MKMWRVHMAGWDKAEEEFITNTLFPLFEINPPNPAYKLFRCSLMAAHLQLLARVRPDTFFRRCVPCRSACVTSLALNSLLMLNLFISLHPHWEMQTV